MKRIVCLCLAAVLVFACTACLGDNAATPTQTSVTTPTTTTTKPAPQKAYNSLTGQYDLELTDPNRPVAIMVPNDSKIIGNQVEIDKADFYFECETEGSIPRLLTAFASENRIPDTYGPVRSARTPFVATARALGAIYVHAGGSTGADAILKTGVIDRINAIAGGNGDAFWRDSDLKKRIDLEHSLVTGDELVPLIAKKKFTTQKIKDTPFTFGDKKGDTAALTFQVNTTPSHRATFVYDEKTGLYGKNIGKLDSYKPHKSLAGNQIKVSNVLVIFGEKFAESEKHVGFRNGDFTAYLFSGGTYRKVICTRSDDSLSFKEQDGSVAQFAEGKIYAVLAANTLESKLIIQ